MQPKWLPPLQFDVAMYTPCGASSLLNLKPTNPLPTENTRFFISYSNPSGLGRCTSTPTRVMAGTLVIQTIRAHLLIKHSHRIRYATHQPIRPVTVGRAV